MSITALVATLNEEENLPGCLKSLTFCDRVVVLDSQSSDDTEKIAHEFGAELIQFPGTAVTGTTKRTWLINSGVITTDWTLIVDADEVIDEELASALVGASRKSGGPDGYYLRFEVHFLGRVLRHGSMDQAFQLRFFRTGAGNYERNELPWTERMGDVEVHERVQIDGDVGFLEPAVQHDDYRGYANWIEKHNRYSTWEAALRRKNESHRPDRSALRQLFSTDAVRQRKALRRFSTVLVARPTLTFLWFYVVKSGWRDGYEGFLFCRARSNYEFDICVKEYEHLTQIGGDAA